MKVFMEKEKKEKTIEFAGKVDDLLAVLEINPENVIVTRDDELLTGDVKVGGDDSIKVLSVLSGG